MPTHPNSTIGGILLVALGLAITAFAAPPLVHHLEVIKLEKKPMLLTYTSDDCVGEPKAGDRYRFRHSTVEGGRRVAVNSGFVEIGALIFRDGPCKDRFFLNNLEQAPQRNPRNGLQQHVNIATIEDRKAGRLPVRFEIQKGSRNGIIIRDHIATLRLNTPGQREKLIKVQNGGTFSLPFGRKNPPRLYTFAEVNKNGGIVITFQTANGKSERVDVPLAPE